MIRLTPSTTRTATLFPYTTLFRSPDAVPGCLPHRTEVALQIKLSRRRNRLPAVAFAPRHRVAEEVVRFAPHAQVAEHQLAVGHLRAHEDRKSTRLNSSH